MKTAQIKCPHCGGEIRIRKIDATDRPATPAEKERARQPLMEQVFGKDGLLEQVFGKTGRIR